jgi:hypothetical protein
MGQSEEDQRRAGELFNLSGHIYKVRVGKYTYYRLQFYTADVDEQRLIESQLGGRFMEHMGRVHFWEIPTKEGVHRVLTKIRPWLTGKLAEQATEALTSLYKPDKERWLRLLREARTPEAKLRILKERPP